MSAPHGDITQIIGKNPIVPKSAQIGDFIVARYTDSEWTRHLPWEEWDHAAFISALHPLKIIEVTGIYLQKEDPKNNTKEIREGVVENEFIKRRTVTLSDGTKNKNGNLWLLESLLEIQWLRPVFPNPIREIDSWYIRRSKRKIITKREARIRAVQYAKAQLGEPYGIPTKWNESTWYCSLLIYKSYSRTVTDMYLETFGRSFDMRAGPIVTPEDLVDSPRSQTYFIWKKEQ